MRIVRINDRISIGPGQVLLVMAGPCVIESEAVCYDIAKEMQEQCARLGLSYAFKASFDKANRTSVESYRGPGLSEGLEILSRIKDKLGVPIITDIHAPEQALPAAEVADILQIPAFLCRQTDLLLAAGETQLPVNIKKGQFLAPQDMQAAVAKVHATGNKKVLLTERGTSFGYHNLVVDMRSLVQMAELDVPVIFDATHAVQLPGGKGTASGGRREFVFPLARAAAAVGIQGLFLEVHPEPDRALSDGANSLPLTDVSEVLEKVKEIHDLVN